MKEMFCTLGKLFVALSVLLLLTINLDSSPPVWWDEGWTLSVARNWAEMGHYGRLIMGEPAAPGLEASFPVLLPVYWSFLVFGVGLYQARLVMLGFTLGALALAYYLAKHLYNTRVAVGTILVSLFMLPQSEIHPMIVGRQVLGELPAMFLLLGGYTSLLRALQGQQRFIIIASSAWGFALITKAQVLPFWAASLFISMLVSAVSKNWKQATIVATSIIGSLLLYGVAFRLWRVLFQSTYTPVSGLYEVTAVVTAAPSRAVAAFVFFFFGLPTALGLGYGLLTLFKRDNAASSSSRDLIQVALLIFCSSWLIWYLTLSVGWARYLFAATFVGSIFTAAMLYELTNKFNLKWTIDNAGSLLARFSFDRHTVGALLAILLITSTAPRTVGMLYNLYALNADVSALEVAQYLNTKTPGNAVIETYDSELFFLLNRRYHYPPDQMHVELIRRYFLQEQVTIQYDPLAADPDYLVIGPHGKFWGLYDHALEDGAFRLIKDYTRYSIYQRVRIPQSD